MIKKIKKMSLGMIVVSASVIPLIAITSCGSSVNNSNFIIEAKSNPKVRVIDFKDENYKNFNTLSKVFEGLNENNLENMDVELIGEVLENSPQQIILNAKNGYLINGGGTLESQEFTLLPNIFEFVRIKDVQIDYTNDELTEELINNIDFLQSLFNGIDASDLENLEVSLEKEDPFYTIRLNALNDFAFLVNGEMVQSITSYPFTTIGFNLNITKKSNPIITQEDMINNNYKSLTTLRKLFNGIDQDILEKVTIEINNQNNVQIVLIANEGYWINGEKEFSSESFIVSIVLDVTKKESPTGTITHVDLENDGYRSISVLSKLFNGIKEEDIVFMDVVVLNKLPIVDFLPYEEYWITIKPKNGYTFLDNTGESIDQLTSSSFKTVDVILDIIPLFNPDISNTDIDGENFKELSVLQKLFVGEKDLTLENIQKMDITLNAPVDEYDSYYSITLSLVNGGFLFSDDSRSLSSHGFILKKVLDVSARETLDEIPDHLELLELIDPNVYDYWSRLEILEKLFNGLTLEDIFNIEEIITLEPPKPGFNKQVVTLVASYGYSFVVNGEEVDRINSIEFFTNPIVLDIEPTYRDSLNKTDIENDNYKNLPTLLKLFYGASDLNAENLNNMEIELIYPSGADEYYRVVLTAKEGYVFQDSRTQIESGRFTLS
ncbi:MAG: hypothetical protein ACRC7B_02245 [Metamycoplasmataceae bacterium]